MKKLRITIEGKTYEVTVEVLDEGTAGPAGPSVAAVPVLSPPTSNSGAEAGAPAAVAASGSAPRPVLSQLAGTVVRIEVSVGQTVAPGDTLLVLEAMKMNTSVVAPGAGTVQAISVDVGAVVEEGQVLLTLG